MLAVGFAALYLVDRVCVEIRHELEACMRPSATSSPSFFRMLGWIGWLLELVCAAFWIV